MVAVSVDYKVVQQAANVAAASVTGLSEANAVAFFSIERRCQFLSLVSTLNQAVIVLRNGTYWHILPPATSSSYPGAVFDLGSDSQFLHVGDSFSVYAMSATPTSGSLYGMAT